MTQIIEAVFDGKVFTPESPLDLPPDTRYRLIVEEMPAHAVGDVWDLLARVAGSIEAPSDWSSEHDHYLYGSPKKQVEPEK